MPSPQFCECNTRHIDKSLVLPCVHTECTTERGEILDAIVCILHEIVAAPCRVRHSKGERRE